MKTPTISVSREQRLAVNDALAQGSNPRPAFFGMVALSSLIAALGLIMDSTAIVIGAMLVAPLMTPILGIALAMVRRDPRLLGSAVRAEAAGVAIAVVAALLLGLLIPYFEATPEMLSRTQPNLLDLAVALLAGLAGAYALVDERLSPALPGVAISTAIVPPLANAGLSASLGAYQGAWGSFMLFFTNFVSILLAAGIVFVASGFGRSRDAAPGMGTGARLAIAASIVAIVGGFLGIELVNVIERRELRSRIRITLHEELPRYRVSEILRLRHFKVDDQVVVLAHVLAPVVVNPPAVKNIEERLEESLNREFQLVVRTTLTEGVSATGSMRAVVSQTLDGLSFGSEDPAEADRQRAEQIIREYLGRKVGIWLARMEQPRISPEFDYRTMFVVETAGIRELNHFELVELDDLVKADLGSRVRIALVQSKRILSDRHGPVRWELSRRRVVSDEERQQRRHVRRIAQQILSAKHASIVSASFNELEDGHHLMLEIATPNRVTPADVTEVEENIASQLGVPYRVLLRPVPDSVVSNNGYTTWDETLAHFERRTAEFYAEETEHLLEVWQ